MTHAIFGMPFDVVGDVGWTLIQFLWQGAVLAILLRIVTSMCRGPVARHNWALMTLSIMAVAPVVTFLNLHGGGDNDLLPVITSGMTREKTLGVVALSRALISPLWIDWFAILWFVGFATLTVRAFGGWYLTEKLRRRDTSSLSSGLLYRCRALQQRLTVRCPVRFLQSPRVSAPVVVGWLRPLVLIPASAIAGISAEQLDALIAHELAHIRRLDPLVNVLLVAVETLLFYHPAVWWVTRRIRIERENCCDDVAVSVCENAADYADALMSLEILKGPRGLAIASNGGRLKQRIARLLGVSGEPAGFSLPAISGLALVCIIVVAIAAAQIGPRFAFRVVDDAIAENVGQAPAGEDRLPTFEPGMQAPSAVWLKRQGAIEGGVVSEAHVTTGPDGKPMVLFTLTPRARDQFAALSRANIGRRIAVVVNGSVVASPVVKEPMLSGKVQISGNYSQAEANRLATEITGANVK
jgi:beta-lactamase regulating signal transducer with metallopeptidase domain